MSSIFFLIGLEGSASGYPIAITGPIVSVSGMDNIFLMLSPSRIPITSVPRPSSVALRIRFAL